MKHIVILGSTGSIGRSAQNVISKYPERFKVVGLTANKNTKLLLEQIEMLKPDVVAVSDEEAAENLRGRVDIPVYSGESGICKVASYEKADFVLSAIVGAAGLKPTLSAIRAGRTIGLANKETLVMAGALVLSEAKKYGAKILPVDSEHSAVFQCMDGRDKGFVKRIILTASGGPFIGKKRDQLKGVTPQDALRHPSWSMGRKITVDSATLMNKGLEVIEAHYLFNVLPEMVDVVIHPQSIIHSVVEFRDGCSLAQMSIPDMRAAIAYALSYPERLDGVIPSLNLCSAGKLTFMEPDIESFPCLSMAYEALRQGGTMPVALNAANEAAVDAFLKEEIEFNDIPDIINLAMRFHERDSADTLDSIMNAHEWALNWTREMIKSKTHR